jgi:glutathione S-transferase
VPEVPGLVVEGSGGCRAKGIAKRIVAQQRARRPNVLGSSELHELAEQALWAHERFDGRLPPDVPLRQRQENVSAHIQMISLEIEGGRPLLRGGREQITDAAVAQRCGRSR